MYVIRDVFHAKPGKAKDVVAKFKAAAPFFQELGVGEIKIMTDIVSDYWTVVLEISVEEVGEYFSQNQKRIQDLRIGEAMKGYMDLVDSGHREIFKVE